MTSPCNKPCASTPRWRHEHPEAAGIAQLQDTGGEEILVSDTGSEHALRFGGGGAAAVASSCPRFTGFSASRGSDSDAGASDTMGHDDLAYHCGRTHPAAASLRGADPGTLAAADHPAADRRLLCLLRAGPRSWCRQRPWICRGSGHRPPPPAGWGERQRARRRAVPANPPRPPGGAAARADRACPPRRAGLAFHLGAVLGLPTVGVTTRPLVAGGAWPADQRGATAPLRLGGELVGCWVRTRAVKIGRASCRERV